MKIFLKMKAWQLFLLLFGAYFTILAGTVLDFPPWVPAILPIGMLMFMAVFVAWVWSLGTNINRKVPEYVRPNLRLVGFAIAYSSIYMLCAFVFFLLTVGGYVSDRLLRLIVPFHLLAMACMFYAIYFVAQNLIMVKRKEKVGFYECAGPFFLLWMCPIGV